MISPAGLESIGDRGEVKTTVVGSALTPPLTVVSGSPIGAVSRNCSGVPSHIYVVCWSDWNLRQGLYAKVESPGGTIIDSGDSNWEIEAGVGSAGSRRAGSPPHPNIVKGFPNHWRALTSDEVLNSVTAAKIGFPGSGSLMWAKSLSPRLGKKTTSFDDYPPFTPGANHGEFVAFRVALPQLPPAVMEIELKDLFRVDFPKTDADTLAMSLKINDTTQFDEIANQINGNRFLYVYIDTYTSIEAPEGTDPSVYNKALSERRAKVIKTYLESKITISGVAMVGTGHGGAPATDASAYLAGLPPTHELNRRATISLLSKPRSQ